MTAKKSLQKFTETENKINRLLELDKVTPNDYKDFTKDELIDFSNEVTKRLNESKGIEKDKLLDKLDTVIVQETKNQLWENNHNQITWAISTLMQDYGRMPSKTEIANKTELSRQTIHKHLKEYTNHSEYLEQVEQFRFMTSKVLAKVFQFAVNGDMRASKLYFQIMSNEQFNLSNKTQINTQNNYIQINGMIFNDEKLKGLKPEQLKSIETILLTANHEQPLFEDAEIIQKKEA